MGTQICICMYIEKYACAFRYIYIYTFIENLPVSLSFSFFFNARDNGRLCTCRQATSPLVNQHDYEKSPFSMGELAKDGNYSIANC